jgi:hypothetical protein
LDRLVEAIRHGIGEPWLRWPFGEGAELDRRMSAAATDTEGFWRNATHHTPARSTVASATKATALFTV